MKMRSLLLLSLMLSISSFAQPPTLTPTYSSISAQIFQPSCMKCHSTGGGGAPRGGVDLTTYDLMVKSNDPVNNHDKPGFIIPGDSAHSTLCTDLMGPKPRMPKRAAALAPEQAQAVCDWIQAGAINDEILEPAPEPAPAPRR